MTSSADIDTRDVLKKAYLEIKTLRSRLAESEDSRTEPIAIVGLGCRFPGGAVDAESFWSLLHGGVDAVGAVPPDRWDTDAFFDADPDAPGKLYTRDGSFVDGVDRFDAELFGISPLEASSMDPQQRLLLEVAWEALENAGLAPESLRASRTGVFVGLMYQDYLSRQLRETGNEGIGPYLGTGSTFSAAAGRLSYVLGLQGPSMAIDTACSSSLVAVHLACQALRNRECDVTLAGGANVMLTPEASINLSKARMLSPTGRCRTFDAAADGYIRGEGCGLIVLKRLSQARTDGDRVLGLVRGSAVNQDGRSSGLTAPNGSAQRTLIREALQAARITADDVEYVECHGTGTPLGDPIEVGALLDVYGSRSEDRPLAIGSVKTNFGHLESAAGICGLIKALLVLRHREVPPHLHLTKLNPHIRIEGRPVVIPTTPTPWFGLPSRQATRMAAVSAFGFVGTNAHVILESFDESFGTVANDDRGALQDRSAHVLTLSAATEPALGELRERFVRHLENASESLGDICFTANTGRSHLQYRLAVVASDAATMKANLQVAQMHRVGDAPRVAFLFPGEGSHDVGAGRQLYAVEPVFRAAIDRCDRILRQHLDSALTSLLFGDDGVLLAQTRYAQPALVALEYALFEQWRAWGIEPSIVLGHSVGDYAAAIAIGELTIEEGLAIVAARGRLMQALPAGGGMAAVFATEAWAQKAIARYPDTLAIAAVNAPAEVVLSGRHDHLREVLGRARAEGLHARKLNVSHAFHSPLMRPMLAPFREVLSGAPNAERWLEQVLAPVRFTDSVETLRLRGDELLLELGPRPVLAPLACRTLERAIGLSSLRASGEDGFQMFETLATLHIKGVRVDWRAVDAPFARRKVSLPTYAFQRERYWIKPATAKAAPPPAPPRSLLGTRLPQAPHQPETFVWDVDVDRTRRPYLFEHKVLGSEVWPIAAQMELALDAAREALGAGQCCISVLEFKHTLNSLAAEDLRVQVVLTKTEDREGDFRIYSRAAGATQWVLNTTARVSGRIAESVEPPGGQRLELSMMFFAAKEDDGAEDRYRLIFEAARFADRNGFRSVWVPERHFTHMGSLYPNPSVLHAALARETKHVRLMAGSVVLPLHHVARIAEEWAMVDNLSGGRVGMSFASGWNPDDFVLAPGDYEERYNDLYAGIETLRRLWRGEPFEAHAPHGRTVRLRTYPTPVQAELPLWITAARSPESFQRAGTIGANLLTHLLEQDVDTLAGKIALYREAREENGFDPAAGIVTVMCHTFVAADADTAHRLAKEPFCNYLKSSMPLLAGLAYSRGKDVDVHKLSESELDEFVEFLYERFSTTRALIGSPESCRGLIDTLEGAGVNEIACLLDFGPATDAVIEHLPYLASLRVAASTPPVAVAPSPAAFGASQQTCRDVLPVAEFYATLSNAGVDFEGSLRSVAALAIGDREALATIPATASTAVVLDACIQSALAALPRGGGETIRIPTAVRSVRVHRPLTGVLRAHGRVTAPAADGGVEGAVTVFDAGGNVAAEIDGLHVKSISRPGRDQRLEAPAVNDDWFYEVAWRAVDWPERPVDAPPRPWLILEDRSGVAHAWAARHHGTQHVYVQAGAVTEQIGPSRWTVDPATGFLRLLRQLDPAAYEGILCLWPLDALSNDDLDVPRLESDQRYGLEAVTSLVQALAQIEQRDIPPVWLATRGAQPVTAGALQVSQSPLWGFAGALAREHREWWGGIVDLDPFAAPERSAEDLDWALRCGGDEDQTAVRGGRRYVRRLVRSSAPAYDASFGDDATYLIAGGAGGLGLEVARWMIGRGARHLLLIGRTPGVQIPPMDADVRYAAVDIADESRLAPLLAELDGPPVRGVIHAAGVFKDEALLRLDRAILQDVLRAKVSGAWALHRVLTGADLDFFILFSSFSAITPPHGQAAYAAASAFLDALAHARRAEGRPALSINWGAWSEVGFAVTASGSEAHARLEALGMRRMTPRNGLAALQRLMNPGVPAQMAVFPMNVRDLVSLDPTLTDAPLLRELGKTTHVPDAISAEVLLHALRQMDASKQRGFLQEQVGNIASAVLEIPLSRLDLETPLLQLGLDSLIAVQLKNRLQKEVGCSMPLVSTLSGASVASMVDDLMLDLRLGALSAAVQVVDAVAQQELEL